MKASRALPVLAAMLLLGGCVRVIDDTVAGAISKPATEVRARAGAEPMRGDPQTLMTRLRPARAGDRDVEAAEAAGYRSFPPEPGPTDRMIHYVHRDLSQREIKRIDPTRPGALLYERDGEGGLRLVGAMFTAPVEAPLEELNARVPLSATQWHLHQNVCVPRSLWDKQQWARKLPGDRPAFGPGSPTQHGSGHY